MPKTKDMLILSSRFRNKNSGQILKFAGHFLDFFKSLKQNSTQKLKVKIQFYVDSENFMKSY